MTHVEHGFGPVWDDKSQVLVLGSMPSPKSREMRFYYGHKRNRFWPVMAAVFHDDTCLCEGMDAESTVAERRDFALRHHMALWDVIASCDIATTGAKAAQLYRRLCVPALARSGCRRPAMTQLPSTSPANAGMRLSDLIDAYTVVAQAAGGSSAD